jgi:hypothetical protein
VVYDSQPGTVRVVYVVPVDAEPWEEAKQRATEWLEDIQGFFADEMQRLGYAPKTFEIAKDERGELIFHEIPSPLRKKAFYRGRDYRKNCIKVAEDRGIQQAGDRVVCFHESCSMINGEVFGDGANSRSGYAFLGSLHLMLARREWMGDKTEFEGMLFPWISPEPMKRGMLKGRGSKLGDLSGSAFGIMAHELCHCFGPDEEKDDWENRRVNLMYRGCRRMRGYFRPDLTSDRCFLSKQSATVLDANNFFSTRNLKTKAITFTDVTPTPPR